MNILLLGPKRDNIFEFLRSYGAHVVSQENVLREDDPLLVNTDFIVSYGYRHIIKKPVIDAVQNRVINLHISFLPWNRGADPNLWSFVENTPKGITIHYVDEGLDTGDIIMQKELFFDDDYTLASSYELLNQEIVELFKQHWAMIADGTAPRFKQPPGGSFHLAKDKEQIAHLFSTKGWDIPVRELKLKVSSKNRYENAAY